MATPKDSETTKPFTAADSMSDLTLVVEGKKLYVHKLMLARASPVFKTMLYPEPGTGFQEKDAKEIPLPEKKYNDVVQFLMQIYPDYNKEPVTNDNLVELMALADEYDVNYLVTKCETYIKDKMHNKSYCLFQGPEQLVMYLWVFRQYPHRLQTLLPSKLQKLLERLSECSINNTRESPYFEKLSTEEQNKLILARCLKLERDYERRAGN